MGAKDTKLFSFGARLEVTFNKSAAIPDEGFGTGLRPNHLIPGTGCNFMGQLNFEDVEWLKLGESCMATSHIAVISCMSSIFVPGFAWELCAGHTVFGTAVLKEFI